jgi:hypothetical protein
MTASLLMEKFFYVNFAAIFSRKFSNRFGKEQNVSPSALNPGPSDIYSATPTAKPLSYMMDGTSLKKIFVYSECGTVSRNWAKLKNNENSEYIWK